MAQIERFINNVTPLDAKHLNELVDTLNTLVDKNETVQVDIGNLNDEIENINVLKSQFETIEKKVDDHIETSIDDTTISTDRTWSSAKIEDFVHINDDVVWATAQRENLSIDYTKEGYLREVEIWGNTWQDDTDSKNLWNPTFSTKESFGVSGVAGNGYYFNSISGLKPNSSYTLSIGKIIVPANGYYRIGIGNSDSEFSNSTVKWIVSENNNANDTSTTVLNKYGTNTTGEDGILKVWVWNSKGTSTTEWLFDVCENIQLEEGTIATDYVDYHKADLSDIQHLGELYVDEEGQPILDSEGREQYKIEVESVNGNLFNYPLSIGDRIANNGVSIQKNEKAVSCLEYIEVDIGEKYYICTNAEEEYYRLIMNYDENKNFIDFTAIGENKQTLFTAKSKYIRIVAENLKNDVTPINDIRFAVIKSDTKESYIPHKSHKTTLLLPCQLMKVGDVADRLYWDSEKGKYIVEKNVFEEFIPKDFNNITITNADSSINLKYVTLSNALNNNYSFPVNINNLSNNTGNPFQSANSCIGLWQKDVRVRLDDNKETTVEEVVNKLLELNGLRIYVKNPEPQLIETNVTEQIFLSCYKDKTHLFVTGGLDGTIKAKIPLDGGQAIQSLSVMNLALNEEVSTLTLENEELKSTNDTQDELINTTMLATDEMYMMIEPLLFEVVQTLSLERSVSKMVDMYVAMVQRGLKTIDEVPARYREQVKEILAQLEK